MKILLLDDGYHGRNFVTDSGKFGDERDLYAMLCAPHAEAYELRTSRYEDIYEHPLLATTFDMFSLATKFSYSGFEMLWDSAYKEVSNED